MRTKTIAIKKTIQKIPLAAGLDLCLRVLEKPKDVSKKEFEKQIRNDLIAGRKVFRIRELNLCGK